LRGGGLLGFAAGKQEKGQRGDETTGQTVRQTIRDFHKFTLDFAFLVTVKMRLRNARCNPKIAETGTALIQIRACE
jgi:hypothetical protein